MFGHNKLHQCLIKIILHFINYFNFNFNHVCNISAKQVDISCTHQKTYVLPEDGQELRPKQFGAIIKKNIVLIKIYIYIYVYIYMYIYVYIYIRSIVSRKMYSIKHVVTYSLWMKYLHVEKYLKLSHFQHHSYFQKCYWVSRNTCNFFLLRGLSWNLIVWSAGAKFRKDISLQKMQESLFSTKVARCQAWNGKSHSC
jgi:hypothetical protein